VTSARSASPDVEPRQTGPCGSSGLGSSTRPVGADGLGAFRDFGLGRNTSGAMPSRSAAQGVRTRPGDRRRARTVTTINDSVHWSAGARRRDSACAHTGRAVPSDPERCSASCRGRCGSPGSRTRSTPTIACCRPLNCLLVGHPPGRVLVETGIGDRSRRLVRCAATRGRGFFRLSKPPGRSGSVDAVAVQPSPL